MQEVTFSIATAVTEAGTTIASAMGCAWDIMTANPILSLCLGASVITMGFRFFRKSKKAANI